MEKVLIFKISAINQTRPSTLYIINNIKTAWNRTIISSIMSGTHYQLCYSLYLNNFLPPFYSALSSTLLKGREAPMVGAACKARGQAAKREAKYSPGPLRSSDGF